jgi:hypothetical protein
VAFLKEGGVVDDTPAGLDVDRRVREALGKNGNSFKVSRPVPILQR